MRGGLVILAAIALCACQPPQSIDRAFDGTNAARSSGGGAGNSARGSGGSGGRSDDGNGQGGAGNATPDAQAEPPAPGGGSGAMDAPSPLELGKPCTSNMGCASGFCVDNVCCDSACAGTCQACDVPGQEGACAPVAKGQDPDDECPMNPAASCMFDGTCDGQGACARYAAGTVCIPGSCSAGIEHAARTCDGQGQCGPGKTQACQSGVCDGSSCGGACSAAAPCQPGFFCDAGTCRLKLALAATCTMDAQCAAGHCVDGVCCATACNQMCYACNLPGSVGSCLAVADGQDPNNECPGEAAATCGRAGGCNGRGACKLQPAGTNCAAGSCSNGVEVSARTCNGLGVCAAASSKQCGDYACKGVACATSCAGNADCKAGLSCVDGACGMPPAAPAAKIGELKVHDSANASQWSVQKNFQIGTSGVRPWADWPMTYVSGMDTAANLLLGAEWVKVATESKKYNGGPQATLTLRAAADVYLAVDDRWGEKPGWLSGWTNTTWKMRVWESSSKSFPFTLFVKKAPAGMVTVPAINDNDAYDYFIVVK